MCTFLLIADGYTLCGKETFHFQGQVYDSWEDVSQKVIHVITVFLEVFHKSTKYSVRPGYRVMVCKTETHVYNGLVFLTYQLHVRLTLGLQYKQHSITCGKNLKYLLILQFLAYYLKSFMLAKDLCFSSKGIPKANLCIRLKLKYKHRHC